MLAVIKLQTVLHAVSNAVEEKEKKTAADFEMSTQEGRGCLRTCFLYVTM